MRAPPVSARRPGVVYTPAAVTAPMVARALDPLAAGRTIDEILALRVCDPALGEGAFLLAAIERLADHAVAAGADRDAARAQVAAGCVFGVDLDPAAIEAARAAIEAATGVAPEAAHLVVGDALTLAWPAVFGAPFDVVVGNPPYIRQELLADAKPGLRGFEVYAGGADLYVYFVELVHRIVRPGGRWCLVVPNKWLTAAYARPLRAFLERARSVEGIVDFAEAPRMFEGADAFPAIVWGEVTSSRPGPSPVLAARSTLPVGDALAPTASLVPHARGRFTAEPWHIDTAADAATLAALAARWPPLAALLTAPPARGVVTGCNRAFVVDAAARARLVSDEPTAARFLRPFVRGRDIRRFTAAPSERYLLTIPHGTPFASLPAAIRAHLEAFRAELAPRPPTHAGPWPGRKPGAYAWHELQDPLGPLLTSAAPRLLYQDIQTQPACALDATGALAADTTVWMLPTADRVLLAILGSSLYGWYARRRFPPALGGAVRPKRAYLLALPIAQPAPPLRAHIEALVEAQLVAPTAARDAELDAAVLAAYELPASAIDRLVAAGLEAIAREVRGLKPT